MKSNTGIWIGVAGLIAFAFYTKNKKNKEAQEAAEKAAADAALKNTYSAPAPKPAPKTAVQAKVDANPSGASTSDRIKRATEIYNTMGSGTPARVRIQKLAAAVYFDKSKNAWIPTGGNFYIAAPQAFYKSAILNDPRKNGVFIVEMALTNGSRRIMNFDPANIYVY